MAIVYLHKKKNTDIVFYVGIGNNTKRAYTRASRNKWWTSIADKYGYDVEIIKENISWDEACLLEIELIRFYGRMCNNKGTLCNLTDGGDGVLGLVFSKESKERMRQAQLGKKHSHSEKTKRKIGLANKGKLKGKPSPVKGKNHSLKTIKKMSLSKKGKPAKNKRAVILNNETVFNSITEVALKMKIGISTISNNLSGLSKKTSVGVWKYYNN